MVDNVSSLWLSRSMLRGYECAGRYSKSVRPLTCCLPALFCDRKEWHQTFRIFNSSFSPLLFSNLWILSEPVFPLPLCEQDSTAQDSNYPFACLVLNCLVLSLLLWRNSPPPACPLTPPPPPFGNPNKNGGRSRTKTIVASKKNWKDRSNHCHHTLPLFPRFLSFFFPVNPTPIQFQCEKCVVSLDKVPICKPVCVWVCTACTAHTKSIKPPVDFSLNKTCLSA